MKTKRFDFNFKPLRILTSFGVDGSVPGRQVFDGNNDGHIPDYRLTPLVLRLSASRQDKDEVLANGEINSLLTNVVFYQVKDGVKTQITNSSPYYVVDGTQYPCYAIDTTGVNAGRILVKENVDYLFPVTIIVEADYLDTRLNQTHHISESYLLVCDNGTAVKPEVELDIDSQTIWNPLEDEDSVTVNALLRLGATPATADSHLLFRWQKLRSNGQWSDIGSEPNEDYDCSVSSATSHPSLTIDRRKMGAVLKLRCVGLYDPDGTPSSSDTITDATPQMSFDIVRRIPKYDYNYVGVPTNIPPGTPYLHPEAVVEDSKGVIANPEREIHFRWMAATNAASGNLTYTEIGHGPAPTLPTSKMNNNYGMVLGIDPVDAGAFAAWLDSDGKVLVDGDGKILLIR